MPFQKGSYCYFINAANDHYSSAGIPLIDRNPEHLTLHDSYLYELIATGRHAPRWLDPINLDYMVNPHPEQWFSGAPHMSNISVIDYPDTAYLGYYFTAE